MSLVFLEKMNLKNLNENNIDCEKVRYQTFNN